MTTACGNEEGGPGEEGGGNGGGPTTNIITASDAQQEIDRVGRELANKINAEDFKDIASLTNFCMEKFLSSDEVMRGEEWHPDNSRDPEGPGIYDEDGDDIFDSPGTRLIRIVRHLSATAQGDLAGVTSIKRIAETYGASDYAGIYTWNEETEEWDKEESTSELTYKFNHGNKPCVVTVKKNGVEHSWTSWKKNRTFKIPSNLSGSVTEGGNVLAQLNVNVTECSQDNRKYALSSELKVGNYIIAGSASDDNSTAKANCYMAAKGEKLIEATVDASGYLLADEDSTFNNKSGWNHVKNAKGTYTMLNSVLLNITADNTQGLYNAISKPMDYYYYEYYDSWSDTLIVYKESDKATAEKAARDAADAANRYIKSNISFKNGDYTAPAEWEAYLSYQYSYSWKSDYNTSYSKDESMGWDIRPVLTFDNGGRYTFENYFTQARFSSLISVFESLINDFESLDL